MNKIGKFRRFVIGGIGGIPALYKVGCFSGFDRFISGAIVSVKKTCH